jgi:uncharacterized protein YndB with AHSA1/START domain
MCPILYFAPAKQLFVAALPMIATVHLTQEIAAPPATVWFALWNDQQYRQWTKVFDSSSYAVSTWQLGAPIQFLTADGQGLYAEIAELEEAQRISFKYLGTIDNFEEKPAPAGQPLLHDRYELEATATGGTLVKVWVQGQWLDESNMRHLFGQALAALQQQAEQLRIQVQTSVDCTAGHAWHCFTTPEFIVQWNFASPDWHCPSASADVQPGGQLRTRMEARDGSVGFELVATYTHVQPPEELHYQLADGRMVWVRFAPQADGSTLVTQQFEPENIHPPELQYAGWQSILDNYRSIANETRP